MVLLVDLSAQDSFAQRREEMVLHQIQRRGIKDPLILEAFRNVARHLFVPESQQINAYDDGALPIGYGQTISQPYIVAYMTSIIQPKPSFKVLEIGTGSGYQAAILGELVEKVYTIEIVPELGKLAAERLKNLGYDNIEVKIGDGFHGWESAGPFDAIIVTAAPETIPPPLINQLKEGGKMIIPVGPAYQAQSFKLLEKKNGKIKTKELLTVSFVPFTRN